MRMKILHFAIENFARIPANLVAAEREAGHTSHLLIPFVPNTYFADEDFCLNLPFTGKDLSGIKKILGYGRISDSNKRKGTPHGQNNWQAKGLTKWLFSFRDRLWAPKIKRFLNQIEFDSYDLLVLDGGAGFLRNASLIKQFKKAGKKILITYNGSDFRSRGALPNVEALADYRLTFEHDHIVMDPTLDFYFAPFKMPAYTQNPLLKKQNILRIGHAPTNRLAKGSDIIINTLRQLENSHAVEMVLIENKPHKVALELKASCDIFIDNIGEIGYGINSLESLSMGIPTLVQLMDDFLPYIPNHPFININDQNLREKLVQLIEDEALRAAYGQKGPAWVLKTHDYKTISQKIIDKLYST